MKQTPVETKLFKNATLRENGQFATDVHLVRVKSPQESKYPWDYFAIEDTVAPEQAFLPLSKSKCPLVKK
jgi:branched-chain amino acid transport system substrate-binding protein